MPLFIDNRALSVFQILVLYYVSFVPETPAVYSGIDLFVYN